MEIRTITHFSDLNVENRQQNITRSCKFLNEAGKIFEGEGHNVQSLRIATGPWEEYAGDLNGKQLGSLMEEISHLHRSAGVEFFCPGWATTPAGVARIPDMIRSSADLYCSAIITRNEQTDHDMIDAVADLMLDMKDSTDGGEGNFQFCAAARMPSGVPFFPAACHRGGSQTFALGLEFPGLLHKAAQEGGTLEKIRDRFYRLLCEETEQIEQTARKIEEKLKIEFGGIDMSLAPSMEEEESVATAYEKTGIERFGHPGTLAVSAMITGVLKSIPVKQCGYSGLMLPVCEDPGLARRMSQRCYNLTNLLSYSTVCGTGLDTVPLSGDISKKKLQGILTDVAALALRLKKPLSARLMPVPKKSAGDMTSFVNQYLINCRIPEI